jgi:hypothetical protein
LTNLMRSLAIAALGSALLGLVIFFGLPGLTAWQRVLPDFAHGPVFATLAVLVALALRQRWPAGRRPGLAHYALALLITLALGVFTEFAQNWYNPDRLPSAGDVGRDLLGGIVGLSLLALRDRRLFGGSRAWPAVLGATAAVVLIVPPLQVAAAYALRAVSFPELVQFRSSLDLYFLEARGSSIRRLRLPEPWAGGQSVSALAVKLERSKWPGVALLEPVPDWRGYDVLRLDLVNPGDRPLELTLRILDRTHDWRFEDRYNGRLWLPPRSRQDFRIPLEDIASAPDRRRMDLARIADLLLFQTGGAAGGEFYLVRIALE